MRERLETLFVFAWIVAPCLLGVFCAGEAVGSLLSATSPWALGVAWTIAWTVISVLLSMRGWSPSREGGDRG